METQNIIIQLMPLLQAIIIGGLMGFGNAIGVYFAQKSIIKNIEKIKKEIY